MCLRNGIAHLDLTGFYPYVRVLPTEISLIQVISMLSANDSTNDVRARPKSFVTMTHKQQQRQEKNTHTHELTTIFRNRNDKRLSMKNSI